MKNLRKTLKWLAIIFGPMVFIYILLWFIVAAIVANTLNSQYALQEIKISDTATIKFGHAQTSGFPFCFNIELHDVEENSKSTVINHLSPLIIGYNLINQNLGSYYKGESIAKYKPANAGFGMKISGEYEVHAYVPLNTTLFRILVLKHHPFEIVNYINDLNIKSKNVTINDLIDNAMIIDGASMHVRLSVKHHQYYNSIDELIHAIPKDYFISIAASTQNSGNVPRAVPFSIIYLAYLPFNFKYDFDADIHTEAKEFVVKDIISNIKIQTNKMDYQSDVQDAVSTLGFNNMPMEDGGYEFNIDYKSSIHLLEGFSQHISNYIDVLIPALPSGSPIWVIKHYLSQLDLKTLDIDTKELPIKLAINAHLKQHFHKKLEFDLKTLSIYFANTGFDLKAYMSTHPEKDGINGVLELVDWPKLIGYTSKSYFTIRNVPHHGIYTDDFWVNLYIDFVESIANNINPETANLAIKFNITTDDILKSELGKFSWPEAKLLYYSKLFEHTLAICKDRTEALKQFRMVIPIEINHPEILEKVMQVR